MSKNWWEGGFVALDMETTGVNPEDARIVTAAVVACGGGGRTSIRTWLLDPGVDIPDEAAAIHGVTTEKARTEGEDARYGVLSILAEIEGRVASVVPLVIFNARFDLTILDRETHRYGHPPLPEERLSVVDPLVIDKWLDRYRKGSRQLDALCEHLGIQLDDGGHNAASDALAAARCAYALVARGEVVRRAWNPQMEAEKAALATEWESARSSPARLHAAQVGWAREQAKGLAQHFRGQGRDEDAAGVRPEWPMVPILEEAVVL